jgi:hypothetical protein
MPTSISRIVQKKLGAAWNSAAIGAPLQMPSRTGRYLETTNAARASAMTPRRRDRRGVITGSWAGTTALQAVAVTTTPRMNSPRCSGRIRGEFRYCGPTRYCTNMYAV